MHYFSEAWFTGSENYKSSNSVDDPNSEPDKAVITAQKMKFSIKDFFSKCDQIRRKRRIWSHLLKKSLMEDFIFCAVNGKI